jgi:hypothetical protein
MFTIVQKSYLRVVLALINVALDTLPEMNIRSQQQAEVQPIINALLVAKRAIENILRTGVFDDKA